MRKSVNKILLVIIVVLLVANLVMLFLFVLPSGKKNFHGRRSDTDSGMAQTLREKAGFSEQQIAAYMELRNRQRPVLKGQFSKLRDTKEKYYFSMFENADSVAAVYADSIAQNQKIVDSTMRIYLMDIRKLATPQQLPQFDSVMKKTVWRMIGKPRNQKDSSKK